MHLIILPIQSWKWHDCRYVLFVMQSSIVGLMSLQCNTLAIMSNTPSASSIIIRTIRFAWCVRHRQRFFYLNRLIISGEFYSCMSQCHLIETLLLYNTVPLFCAGWLHSVQWTDLVWLMCVLNWFLLLRAFRHVLKGEKTMWTRLKLLVTLKQIFLLFNRR